MISDDAISFKELARLREKLEIDAEDLDTVLTQHPGVYDEVAEATAMATAVRDELKLDLEELMATHDQAIRKAAVDAGEKISETQVQQRVILVAQVKALRRQLAAAKATVETWSALKESFQQRSYMLKELVITQTAQLQNLGIERGSVSQARRDLMEGRADYAKSQQGALRRRRLGRSDDTV